MKLMHRFSLLFYTSILYGSHFFIIKSLGCFSYERKHIFATSSNSIFGINFTYIKSAFIFKQLHALYVPYPRQRKRVSFYWLKTYFLYCLFVKFLVQFSAVMAYGLIVVHRLPYTTLLTTILFIIIPPPYGKGC